MYKCPSCKKTSIAPGECPVCRQRLEDTRPPWAPRATIDEKQKTGDQDQLGIISAAHLCIAREPKDEIPEDFEERRKGFSLSLRSLPKTTASDNEEEKNRIYEEVKQQLSNMGSDIKEKLQEIQARLKGKHIQFLVNLVMFSYRTSEGGRARKSSDWLRTKTTGMPEEAYVRPFFDPLPHFIESMLSEVPSRELAFEMGGSISLTPRDRFSLPYIPPSRFTASFPLALKGSEGKPRKLLSPQLPTGSLEQDERIKYAHMGSFGFSEPSYTTWVEEEDGPEYSGTRLSLGAYSLNEVYLNHLLQVMRQALVSSESAHAKGYLGYGGVRVPHVEALLKIARRSGHTLALTWARQMVAVAEILIGRAGAKAKGKDQPGLAAFFGFVRGKIERRKEKLKVLNGRLPDLTNFEYVWVIESSLWELALLGATCLKMTEIRDALLEHIEEWKPSVGCVENAIEEKVTNIPTGGPLCDFHRIYAPTGTAAAKRLNEALIAMGFAVHALTPSKDKLHPFVPYFEFYIGEGAFLNSRYEAETPVTSTEPQGLQIWVNLSDSLHSELLEKGAQYGNAGAMIAELLAHYIGTLDMEGSAKKLLVIDFTKLSGEMPNSILYPILAQLARTLIEMRAAVGVVFLRSNLKYNTGALDRYQSGEILVFEDGVRDLVMRLITKVKETFVKGEDPYSPTKTWRLCGEYISLMKKVYLLSDAIGSWRWATYEAEWK